MRYDNPVPGRPTVVVVPRFDTVLRYPGIPTLAEMPLLDTVILKSLPIDFDFENRKPMLDFMAQTQSTRQSCFQRFQQLKSLAECSWQCS